MTPGQPFMRITAFVLAILGCLGTGLWFATLNHEGLFNPLTGLLAGFAIATNLLSANWDQSLEVSGSLVAALLAGAFLGPADAFAVILVAESASWAIERLRPIALPQNIFGLGAPALAATYALQQILPGGADEGIVFFATFGALALAAHVLNAVLVGIIHWLHDGGGGAWSPHYLREMLPVWAVNITVTVAVASIYAAAGPSAAVLMLAGIMAFTYQLRLVAKAEHRTRQYASLSWGVLSGMLRSLDMRDSRTARHSAAVAMFARDIAAAVGLSKEDCELAHTAGLLHDAGKFALSDRVFERGIQLSETDWKGIRRHPELGADMLKDLGMYGPIAQIVGAHHERLDGRGYPAGLKGDAIPEIAKIVAVAEVYDTLTADDTYRAKMSSFEALTELRRVAGSQLEGRYVEALADVLGGTGVDYRHAGDADFDRELDVERRINEAVAP